MEFVTVREFRSSTAKIWRKLRSEKQLVLTRRGKPVAMVTATDERRLGAHLLEEQKKRAGEAIDRIHQYAERKGLTGMTMAQIDALIADSRRAKRK